MGKLINGKWVKSSIITSDKLGNYDRQPRTLRNFISFENNYFLQLTSSLVTIDLLAKYQEKSIYMQCKK